MRILSTEDDPVVRVMLAEILAPEGHDVEFARNSDDFFRLVGAKAFDLLILDVNITGLNGYQIAREIASRLGEKRPKMLLFTGRDARNEKGLVELSGVDAVLEKGGPTDKILEAVNKLMALPAPAPAPEPAPAPKSASAEPAAGIPRSEFDRLMSRISNAVSENASLSHRIELLNKRVAEVENVSRKSRADDSSSRQIRFAFALLALAFAALLFVFLSGRAS